MKKCIFLIIILLFLFTSANEFYTLNIRQSFSNYYEIQKPGIDIYINSLIRKDASITFYASLIDFYPFDFVLSLDSMRTGFFNHRLFIGDKYYPILDFGRIRGIGYDLSFSRYLFGIAAGQSRDLFYSQYPSYNHNQGELLTFANYSFTPSDTTSIYFVLRNDDTKYNLYTKKTAFGLKHKSEIARIVRLGFDIRKSDYHSFNDSYSLISGRYQINSSFNRLSLNFRGEYIPQDYISLSNMTYIRGILMNVASGGLRITDELSIYALYQITEYSPNDSLSYDKIGAKISTRIPFLPHISFAADYSRYIESNDLKNLLWRINAGKRFGPLSINASYSNQTDNIYKRQNTNVSLNYCFTNNTRTGLRFNLNNANDLNYYRYSGFISWSPHKIWDIEFGTDYSIRNNDTYISEYLNSSFAFENVFLTTQVNMRFQEQMYLRFAVNLSIRNRLTDFHLSCLKGRVFYDENQNGVFDKGESTVPDALITLNDTIRITTGKNGMYSFKFLKEGTYNMKMDKGKLPAYFDIKKDFYINLRNFRTVNIDIPLIKMSSITGFVFDDYNKNGLRDDDEPGISGVIVKLQDTNVYTYTDNNGYYILSNLPQGNYILEIPRMPKDYNFSIPNLINYISIKSFKADYLVDFGLMKESKPIRKKVF